MASNATLSYHAPWFRIGDSENGYIALLYGIIAMVTLWVLEDIVSVTLSWNETYLSMAELVTLMAYKGWTWFELVKKATKRWKSPSHDVTIQSNAPPSTTRVASFGVFVRLFVSVMEIFIIFLAVPSSTPVRGSEVDASQLTFQSDGVNLELKKDYDWKNSMPCSFDNLEVSNFNPTAVRMICPKHEEPLRLSRGKFRVRYFREDNEFRIDSKGVSLSFAHLLHQPNHMSFNLPAALEKDPREVQALRDVLRANYSSRSTEYSCSISILGEPGQKENSVIQLDGKCKGKVPHVWNIYIVLVQKLRTRKTNKFWNDRGFILLRNLVIGKASRPKVCLIPACAILVCLLTLRAIQMFCFKEDSVENKIFKYFWAQVRADSSSSPFHFRQVYITPCKFQYCSRQQNNFQANSCSDMKTSSESRLVIQENTAIQRQGPQRSCIGNSNHMWTWFILGVLTGGHIFVLSFLLILFFDDFQDSQYNKQCKQWFNTGAVLGSIVWIFLAAMAAISIGAYSRIVYYQGMKV